MKKRAFVTGGSGFVGQRLIKTLIDHDLEVLALARSSTSLNAVTSLGARAIHGDLNQPDVWKDSLKNVDVIFNCAAQLSFWGEWQSFLEANVSSLSKFARIAKDSGVPCFVHVSAASVVMSKSEPMLNVTESHETTKQDWMLYSKSKALGEMDLLTLSDETFRTMVIRPPFIWGRGDAFDREISVLIKKGRYAWIGGGDFPYSVAHVDNVCHALLLAFEKGKSSKVYFVRDEEQTTAKEFFLSRIQNLGLPIPRIKVSYKVAFGMSRLIEHIWQLFKFRNEPPLTREMARLMGLPFTISIDSIQNELGYRPITSRSEGLMSSKPGAHR